MDSDRISFWLAALIFLGLFGSINAQTDQQEFSKVSLKMGSRFEVIAVTPDSTLAGIAISAAYQEIDRIENLISSWKPHSQTSLINANAGLTITRIDRELYDLIFRSLKVSELTNGAFDITFAGINDLWKFQRQRVDHLPDSSRIASAIKNIGYQKIQLNRDSLTVYLPETGMRIGFGSIGKGYAANRAMKVMKSTGIESGMVNAGGDLITWGKNKHGTPWSIGIADPNKEDEILAWLSLQDMALVTSGDYQKFFTYNGQRFGHIIDPRSGYPSTGIKSVSILCADAELADALATAVYVLGSDNGMKLINQLNHIEGLIVTADDRLLQSKNLTLKYFASE
ncbi:MAG: FAD:protein FMN transferase [Cyclobacteriaceae bacterium]|nr:MAG: FAD:protein FMN transferase [Cyclobacteriaceae bacterium]